MKIELYGKDRIKIIGTSFTVPLVIDPHLLAMILGVTVQEAIRQLEAVRLNLGS